MIANLMLAGSDPRLREDVAQRLAALNPEAP
jgi:hypothetical protein